MLGLAHLAQAGPVAGQVPLELRGRRVVEVEIAGETAGITAERELGIPLGAPASRRLVRSALGRLAASGRWADVQIDLVAVAGGVRVVAHLTPRVLLTRVEVLGNRRVPDDELLRSMQVSAGDELRDGMPEAITQVVEEAYRERGYERTEVRVVVRDTDDPSRKVLLVRVAEGPPTRIARIRFQGVRPPRESQATSALDLEVGDVLDRRRVEEAVRDAEARIRERGWLEGLLGPALITREEAGAIVTIPSRPGPRYELDIRGYPPLTRGDVEDVLDLGEEHLDEAVVSALGERVVDLYRRHGFPDARAGIRRIAGAEEGTAYLRVSVVAGEQLDVVAITFPGARHFETNFLRDQVFSYLQEDLPGSSIVYPVDTEVADAIGLGGTRRFRREVPTPLVVEPQRIFYEPTYEEAVEHVQELYQAAGYLSARAGPANLRRLEGNRSVVEVPIVEGPRTMLHQVRLEGNEVLSGREILVAAGLERGEPFSHLALEQARLGILDLYRDHGHLFARVDPAVRFSGDRTRAEIRIEIVEAFPVHVGELIIQGANRTSEDLIRDRLSLEPGDLYRPSLARESQERLLSLGVFSGVNVAPQDADLPAQVKPVVVTVTERRGQYLDLTAGFSSGEGIRGGFEYGYRNLFGYAVTASLRVQLAYQFIFVDQEISDRYAQLLDDGGVLARLERNVTVGLAMPHVPKLQDVRLSLDVAHVRDNERDFGLDKNGVGLTLAYRPLRRLQLSVSGNLENNNVDLLVGEDLNEYLRNNMDPRLERLLRVPEGDSTIVALPARVTLDSRDNPFIPSRGMFASAVAEYARTLRTDSQLEVTEPFVSNFVKLALTTNGYVPLSDQVVFAAQVRVGRIFHLVDDSKTYPNRSFFLGGVETMRGYLQDALIPQDLANQIAADPDLDPGDVVRGGDAFVLVRGELRFPIFGSLHGGLFADIGNLWADPAQLEPFDLRPTAGAGLRLVTPVGPLALDYGIILDRRKELQEPFGAFHFSIGLF